MCQRITCPMCGKPSFTGCGRHVEAVLGDVPPAERCQCQPPAAVVDAEAHADRPAGEGRLSDAVKRLFSLVGGGGRERRRP